MTIDYDSSLGQVRNLIPDVDESDFIFGDDRINAFLATAGDSILRATALALRAIANEVNLILKYVKTDDLSTNGPAVAAELRQNADKYDKRADDAASADASDYYDVVPFDYSLEDPWDLIAQV